VTPQRTAVKVNRG